MALQDTHGLLELIQACRRRHVLIWDKVMQEKQGDYFNLRTMDKIQAFIANGDMQNTTFIKMDPLKDENWRYPPPPPIVLTYYFTAGPLDNFGGPKSGYLAFFWNHITEGFAIKSFKKNIYPFSVWKEFKNPERLQ